MTFKHFSQSPRLKSLLAKKRQGGYIQGLVIVIVVLAIIGIGILTIGYNKIYQSKVQNEIQFISDWATNTKAYGAQIGLFTAANSGLAALVGRGFFAPQMVGGTLIAPTVTNQYKGAVTVAVGNITVAGDSLNFSDGGIPDKDCKLIGTSLDNIAATVTINGTVTKAFGAASVPATVDANCNLGAANVIVVGMNS